MRREPRYRARWIVGLLVVAAAALALAPSSASAAAPNCTDSGPDEQTCTFRVPIEVAGYEVLQETRSVGSPNRAPQLDGHITKMETDIVDAGGAPLPISRLMLHHIVFLNVGRWDATCSRGITDWDSTQQAFPLPERFYAAGEERAKISMPDGYGYPLNASTNNSWILLYMVMNHRGVTDNAFVQYTMTVDTSGTLTPVKPYWMDINDCHVDPFYNVPGMGKPGTTQNRTQDVTITEPGRIVAGIGHVHGGAQKLSLTQPGCDNRQVAESLPTWGDADHPFYNVRPILHEPGPINMTAFRSQQGIPVNDGEVVRLNSIYDNSKPHTRVMGIEQIYVAPDPGVTQNCQPLPTDMEILGSPLAGRSSPPPFTVPLTGLDSSGQAVTIKKPPGKLKKAKGGTVIPVGDRFFSRPNVQVKVKKGLTWQFSGNELHNITLANGPAGIASENLDGNRTFWSQLPKKGTYNFFCSLHPVQMHQRIVVKGKKKKRKKGKRRKR
jgi:plastocyanin